MTIPATGNNRITALLLLMIVGWISILLMESSQPPAQIMGEVHGLDKVAHVLAFGVLGLLVCALSFQLRPRSAIPIFSLPLLVASSFGIIEESYQTFVPGRTGSFTDLLADICGAIFAIVLANRIALLSRTYRGIGS